MIANITIKVKQWKDKKTGSWVIYYKKGDICAYGQTKEKARIMFLQAIDNVLWDSMSETQKRHVNPAYKRSALKLEKILKSKR